VAAAALVVRCLPSFFFSSFPFYCPLKSCLFFFFSFARFSCPLLFSSLLSGDLLFGFEHHHFTNYFTLDHNSFCDFISAP